MNNYTLIFYRRNYTDYCRQCEMGRSDSSFAIEYPKTIEEALSIVKSYIIKNNEQAREYADYEYLFLVNGIDIDYIDDLNIVDAFYKEFSILDIHKIN